MKRAAVLFGSLLVPACLSATAIAQPATAKPGQLVIVATGQTHGTFTIKRAMALATAGWSRTVPAGTVSSHSPYIGVEISQGRKVVFGFYVDHALADIVTFGDNQPELSPGRYDVTVIARGPATVRLPIKGSGRMYVKLTQPGIGSRIEANAMPAPATPVDSASVATRVTSTSATLLILNTTATAENVGQGDLCLTVEPLPCAAGSADEGSGGESSVVNTATSHNQAVLFVAPGDVPPGRYFATADQVVVGLQESATLIVITIGS